MFRRDARNKLRSMGGIMASSEPLIQEVAKFQDGQSVRNPSPSFFYEALRRLGNVPDILKPRDIRVKDPSELNPSNLTQALKEVGRPDVETQLQRASRIAKTPFTIGPAIFADAVKKGLKFNPINPNQLTDASILAIEEGTVNEQGERVYAPRPSGMDMIQQIKNSTLGKAKIDQLLGMDSNLLEASRLKDDSIASVRKETGPPGQFENLNITPDKYGQQGFMPSGEIITDQSKAPEGVKVTFGEGTRFRRDAEEEELRKGKAAATLAMQEAERDAEQLAMREAEKQRAIAGGMPLSNQVGATDVEALQDQISGGRISSGAGQTLGVTADQGTEYKHALETEKYRKGQESNIAKTVQDTVNSGIGTGGALKQLMKEFTSNAPKYEGMDRGLAIAKIGFAMAAGQSPNAITNIAKALSDGADMFIQDDAERRRFKRQVDLSALQYGLGEISKQRTQARADARNFMKYVATKDMEYKGVKYEEGEDVLVSMTDLLANGGRLPPGLRDQALHLKFTQAVIEKEKANAKRLEEMRKELLITDEQATKIAKNYQDAASKFKSADTGIAYFEQALDILAKDGATGAAGLFKNIKYKTGNFLGIELGKKYDLDDVEELKRLFAQGLQPLIKVTLGETQSANSISNRDVEFLIKAFFGDRALEEGVFNFATSDNEEMAKRVQAAMRSMRQAQIGNLNTMNTIERRLSTRILPGEEVGSGLGLIEEAKAGVSPYLPGATNQVNPGGFAEIFDTGETQGGIPIFRAKGLT